MQFAEVHFSQLCHIYVVGGWLQYYEIMGGYSDKIFQCPLYENNPFLTKDVHHTISNLCKYGPSDHIHIGDIEKFYPNTPPMIS